MKVKLPRKIKKVYKSLCPEKSYSKIYSRMIYGSDSTLHKILDYVYCINNAYRGYKPSWLEITKHRLFKQIGNH